MPAIRTILYGALLLAIVAATRPVAASESPLSFGDVWVSGRTDVGETFSDSRRLVPPNAYPYIVHERLGPLLDSYFEIHATLVASDDPARFAAQTALSLHLPATYEVYCDETLIGRNGQLGPDGNEIIQGKSYKTFALPTSSNQPSRHTLRIRGYHSHPPDTSHLFILNLRTVEEIMAMERRTAMTYTLYLGFALFGIYLLAYYTLNRRQYHYLFLGATCVLFGLYAVNKLLYFQLNVSYSQLGWIGSIGASANALLSVTAPVSVLLILRFRWGWAYGLALLPFALSKTIEPLSIAPATFYLCAAISLLGLVRRKRHALQCVSVSTILVCAYEVPFLLYNQAIVFGALMLYFLIAVIVLLSKESKKRIQEKLRNSRLQLELLKSKVQPHFVLNSLTSAIEWIETNPREGVQLIQELAKEFELLSRVSDQARIPIATEIESCRAYLKIMEYRKKAKYELELVNVRHDDTLPPAVIRNLLENAITHNAYAQSHVVFHLEQQEHNGGRRFRFSAPLCSPTTDIHDRKAVDGTGIQYIKARLAESYGTWKFSHGQRGNAWVTEIQIPA